MAAPAGNNNAGKGKQWSDAIRKVINEVVEDNSGEEPIQRKRLIIIARKVATMAQAGDIQAIREVGDRLDGKAAQSIALEGDLGFNITMPKADANTL